MLQVQQSPTASRPAQTANRPSDPAKETSSPYETFVLHARACPSFSRRPHARQAHASHAGASSRKPDPRPLPCVPSAHVAATGLPSALTQPRPWPYLHASGHALLVNTPASKHDATPSDHPALVQTSFMPFAHSAFSSSPIAFGMIPSPTAQSTCPLILGYSAFVSKPLCTAPARPTCQATSFHAPS